MRVVTENNPGEALLKQSKVNVKSKWMWAMPRVNAWMVVSRSLYEAGAPVQELLQVLDADGT